MGATRILAPAARALVARNQEVLAVSRGGPGLQADALLDSSVTLLPGTLSGALLYGPAVSEAVVAVVAARCDGPVVHILTSRAADPAAALPAAAAGVRRLVLGWRPDRTWHSPEEVSAAALALFDSEDAADVLGVVQPWADRPE